ARADAAIGVRPPVFIIDTVAALVENVLRTPLAEQVYIASLRRKLDAMAAAQSEPQRAETERANLVYLARAEAIVRDHILPAHQRTLAFLRAERANATEEAGVSR